MQKKILKILQNRIVFLLGIAYFGTVGSSRTVVVGTARPGIIGVPVKGEGEGWITIRCF